VAWPGSEIRVDTGVWRTEVPQRGQGAEPWWEAGDEAPEARHIYMLSGRDYTVVLINLNF